MKVNILNAKPVTTEVVGQTPAARAARERAIARLAANPEAAQQAANATPGGTQLPPGVTLPSAPAQSTTAPETPTNSISETPAVTPLPSESAPPAQEPPKEDDKLTQQFAQLARKEKGLLLKRQEQDQREQALAAREQALAAKEQGTNPEHYIAKAKLAQNPLQGLIEAGLSYEDLTKLILTTGEQAQQPQAHTESPHIKLLQEQIQKLSEKLEASEKKHLDQRSSDQKKAYDDALKHLRNEANRLITSSEDFETIKATNQVDEVVKLIERTHQEEGVLLSVREAAQLIEDELVEDIIKVSGLNKIKAKLKIPSTQQEAVPQTTNPQGIIKSTPAQPQPPVQTMKTLTNAVGATKPLSKRERAIAAFNGTLNK